MQIERMHPFDSRKFGKVMHALQNEGFFSADQVGKMAACSPRDTQLKHTEAEYLITYLRNYLALLLGFTICLR